MRGMYTITIVGEGRHLAGGAGDVVTATQFFLSLLREHGHRIEKATVKSVAYPGADPVSLVTVPDAQGVIHNDPEGVFSGASGTPDAAVDLTKPPLENLLRALIPGRSTRDRLLLERWAITLEEGLVDDTVLEKEVSEPDVVHVDSEAILLFREGPDLGPDEEAEGAGSPLL